MVRLSIIVPFYNVENYIEQCIRSLYCQDIPTDEYEVICVDDCSPDHSAQIVKQLQAEFHNLFIIKQKQNHKLGSARNLGVKYAKGKYIWFVDSDDYLEPNCFKALLQEAEQNDLDILHFDYNINKEGIISRGCNNYFSPEVKDGISFIVDENNEKWFKRCPVVWRRLHKAEFLRKHNLSFADDVMFEDTDYSFRAFLAAKRVKHINYTGYCYRINPTSVTSSKQSAVNIMEQVLQLSRCADVRMSSDSTSLNNILTIFLHDQLLVLRRNIKISPKGIKKEYLFHISHKDIKNLKNFCNWRTWLCIRFAITFFV